jgi:putative transposase
MNKSRFTEAQIAHILAQAKAGVPIAELVHKYGMSQASFYAWRKKHSDLSASELRRMKQLEEENRKLKQLVADLSLDKQILQDVLAKKSKACTQARARAVDRAPHSSVNRRAEAEA